MHREDKKLNNKGLSLVELIIAMTILSIVAIVVYQSIVVSARTNGKAKLQHKATSLAQDVMEGLKAESINDILHQFIIPTTQDDEGNTLVGFDIIPRDLLPADLTGNVGAFGSYIGWHEVDGKRIYDDDYTTTADHTYSLYLRNVSMENSKFDVLITMDGSKYVEGSANNKGQNYNSEETVQLPDMDTSYDAITSNCRIYDGEAQAVVGGTFQPGLMKREIVVYIDKVTLGGLGAKVADSVKVEYIYTYNGTKVYNTEETIYDNSSALEYSLRNIFLFFTPGYGYGQDLIRVENPKHSEAVLYLIKQRTDNSNLEALENGYKPKIKINETTVPVAAHTSLANICTNLQENLITGASVNHVEFYYNGVGVSSDADKKDKLHLADLTNSTSKDKIMDVTVEVYRAPDEESTSVPVTPDELKANTGTRFAILTGSIRN